METSKIHVEDMDGTDLESHWNGLASINHKKYTHTYHNTLLQGKSCTYLIHPVRYHPTRKRQYWGQLTVRAMRAKVDGK
jgi:hypothetical protein